MQFAVNTLICVVCKVTGKGQSSPSMDINIEHDNICLDCRSWGWINCNECGIASTDMLEIKTNKTSSLICPECSLDERSQWEAKLIQ